MNREILFRGIYSSNGKKVWVTGNYVKGCADGNIFHHIEKAEMEYFRNYTVDGNTIGEYTGLNDKRMQPIFEGDIVEFVVPYTKLENPITHRKVVVFNHACFSLEGLSLSAFHSYCEVIGSIHDELLSAKTEA